MERLYGPCNITRIGVLTSILRLDKVQFVAGLGHSLSSRWRLILTSPLSSCWHCASFRVCQHLLLSAAHICEDPTVHFSVTVCAETIISMNLAAVRCPGFTHCDLQAVRPLHDQLAGALDEGASRQLQRAGVAGFQMYSSRNVIPGLPPGAQKSPTFIVLPLIIEYQACCACATSCMLRCLLCHAMHC